MQPLGGLMENGKVRTLSVKIEQWAESEQGKQAIKKALSDANNTAVKLEKARQVDPQDLHRHFTL